jgi:hypothetical protein
MNQIKHMNEAGRWRIRQLKLSLLQRIRVRRSWWGGIANRSKWLMVTYPKGDRTHSKSKQRRPGREKRSIDCDGEERKEKMLKARNSFGPYECSREAIDRWRVHLRLDPSCFHSSINLPDNMGPSRKSVTKTSTKNNSSFASSYPT